MQIINDKNIVSDDEMNLIKKLRQSLGGPYLVTMNQEQKDAFLKFMNALKSPVGSSNTIQ